MHWSEIIARQIIERSPNKERYTCAAGISPSGSIHIGNFRDVATSLFVVQALRKLGKNAVLLFSWDEYDRLRKIPKNVESIRSDMEKYIGFPYVDVPNPFSDNPTTYAEYFEQEFESAITTFGIELEYRYQANMYRSGKYVKHIMHALRHRGEIFDILDDFRTQDAVPGEREAYFPVTIYCPECHRDTTQILSLSDSCEQAEYTCKCGHSAQHDFTKDYNCKLAWKIDWPMRWLYEGVDFEPGGKDHASPNGSYQTSKVISEKIFGYSAPIFQGYEFIGLKGSTGKMSGSSGLNLTPDTLLKLYQPEVILWLYAKSEPLKAFDFCFDDGILRQYHEFDTQYAAYKSGKADELTVSIIEQSLITKKPISNVPMNLIVQLGSVVNFNLDLLSVLFEKISMNFSKDAIEERLLLAQYWVEQCAPEKKNTLRSFRNWDVYEAFSDEEKNDITALHKYLKDEEYDLETLSVELYAIVKRNLSDDADKSALKKKQAKFFSNVYQLLIDKETGPRLYLFLFAVDKVDYLRLLDFSKPKSDEEKEAPEQIKIESTPQNQAPTEPDELSPLKENVGFVDFERLDLRVCKIVKCSEIRKSHNCMKLTLSDGIGERVIVSSIKGIYEPESLIGRKIAVFVNLEPKRITGVTSQGMLLAATNNSCGCKLLFVDDLVPEGTSIN